MSSRSLVRVRYAETDQMGFVYHSHFLAYFEIGRTDYFRELGFTYKAMEADGIFMPVVECACRYHLPARYDDELEIRTSLKMLSRLKIRFDYRVVRKQDNATIAEGSTTHVPVGRDGKPCRIPSPYQAALNHGKHS